jgi:hypothetical protein
MDTTRVYIDGFNLYHGLIRPNRAHWLNLSEFARRLNRGDPVDRVIYCTAMTSGTASDPGKPDRQDGYIRALAIACKNVEVVLGNFQSLPKLYPLVKCRNEPACTVRVSVRTEKGTDVNLATRLLHDAHMGRFTRAIVVSGDSDLAEPIRIVAQEMSRVVWVRNPRDKESAEIAAYASNYDRIRPAIALTVNYPRLFRMGPKPTVNPNDGECLPR